MDILNSMNTILSLQTCTAKEVKEVAEYAYNVQAEYQRLNTKLVEIKERVQKVLKSDQLQGAKDVYKQLLALESYILDKEVNK